MMPPLVVSSHYPSCYALTCQYAITRQYATTRHLERSERSLEPYHLKRSLAALEMTELYNQ